jgi:hypothetical protein
MWLVALASCGGNPLPGDAGGDEGAVDAPPASDRTATSAGVDGAEDLRRVDAAPDDLVPQDAAAAEASVDAAGDGEFSSCQRGCGAPCAVGEECIVTDVTAAACLRRCTTSSDCPAGWRCASLLVDTNDFPQQLPPYTFSDRVCITFGVPSDCGPGVCDIFEPPRCLDAHTLQSPTDTPATCAWVFEDCPHGCFDGGGDAGFNSVCN